MAQCALKRCRGAREAGSGTGGCLGPIICTRGRLHPALGSHLPAEDTAPPLRNALHLLAAYSLVYDVIELFRSDIVTNWQSLFGLPNFVELCLRQTVGRQ